MRAVKARIAPEFNSGGEDCARPWIQSTTYPAENTRAWRTGRVRFLQCYVKRLFCILPFELRWAKYGVQG